jgi:uncharacterized protein
MSWVQTVSGRRVEVLSPSKDQICVDDIALALSRICRFGGHVAHAEHYSVAEHCVEMSFHVESDIALHCLLHDAAEAYLGDIVMPVKRCLPDFDLIEERMMRAIYAALELDWPTDEQLRRIKVADLRMLATEKRQLLAEPDEFWPVLAYTVPFDCRLGCYSQKLAAKHWLGRLKVLRK